jgi:hypothetical protein
MNSTILSITFTRPISAILDFSLKLCMAALMAWAVSGCAVSWVSAYDKQSIERTTEISKNALAFYQQIITTEPGERAAAVNGSLNAKYGDIDTQIRVHLLLEQARARNTDSAKIIFKLLGSWEKFSENHHSKDSTALTNATLNAERGILEEHLRAALIAEESKKLVGGAAP